MNWFICFNCLHIDTDLNRDGCCIKCGSEDILYYDESKINSLNDYHRLKVMLSNLNNAKSKVLYILDFAIQLQETVNCYLFPHIGIDELKERRDKVASAVYPKNAVSSISLGGISDE